MSASVGQVTMLPVAVSAYETVAGLVTAVQERCPQPVNSLQIAALLESAGMTDALAQRRFGYQDVFTLAEAVQQALQPVWVQQPAAPAFPTDSWSDRLRNYVRGPVTLLPIVLLSAIIMAYQRFGQWQNEQVLALGVAMLGSLLVTSGFVQGASRKGASYLSQGYVKAAGQIVFLIIGAGFLVVVVTAVIGTAVLWTTRWLPPHSISLLAVAYLSLSILWLVAAVLFLLQQVYWFGVALGIGVGLSFIVLHAGPGLPLSADGALALATALGLAGLLLTTALVTRRSLQRRMVASPVGRHPVVLPPTPHLMVNLFPYFLYGVLYVLMIIAGHLPGWLGQTGGVWRMTAVSTVEVALTLALGGYILSGGVAEHTIHRFWGRIKPYQMAASGHHPEQFNQNLQRFYQQEQATYLRALFFSSGLLLLIALLLMRLSAISGFDPLSWTMATSILFVTGLVGYGLVAWGIFNCMFMITLSQPQKAIRLILVGILVTLGSGTFISFTFAYYYSAIGIILGGLVFVWLSARQLKQIWRQADYYYYASF